MAEVAPGTLLELQGELDVAYGRIEELEAQAAALRGRLEDAAATAATARAEAERLRGELEVARETAAKAAPGGVPAASLAALHERLDAVVRRDEELLAWVRAVFAELCAHTAFASPREERAGRAKAARQVETMRQHVAAELAEHAAARVAAKARRRAAASG